MASKPVIESCDTERESTSITAKLSPYGGVHLGTDSEVICECGKTIHVVVKLELEEKPEPVSAEAAAKLEEFWIESQLSYIENPGGKQIHATQHADGEWKESCRWSQPVNLAASLGVSNSLWERLLPPQDVGSSPMDIETDNFLRLAGYIDAKAYGLVN